MNSSTNTPEKVTFDTILDAVTVLSKELPSFSDGRIDYTDAKKSIAVITFVECKGKILLLKRSTKVGSLHGKWNTVGGYYDELVHPERIAFKELQEEIDIYKSQVLSMKQGDVLTFERKGRTWIYCMYYCTITTDTVLLDYEHTDHIWVDPKDVEKYDLVPFFVENLRLFLPDV